MDGRQRDLQTALPRLDGRLALRIAMVFLISAPLWYIVRRPYLRSVAHGMSLFLRLAVDPEGQRLWRMDGDVLAVNSGIPHPARPGRMVSLRNDGLYRTGWNTLLLFGLIGLTPWRRLKRSVGWVVLAAGIVWLSQALTLAAETTRQVAELHAKMGRSLSMPAAAAWLAMSRECLIVASPVVPVAAMLPVWLRPIRRRGPAEAGAVGRNAPCPCGSGRKSMRCCGA